MTTDDIPFSVFRDALLVAADRMCEARDELCALDAAAGDGDLGATLATGFGAVRELIADTDGDDVGVLLAEVGVQFARKAPSTIGALLGSAFMQAGKELTGTSALDTRHVVLMLRAGADVVAARGRAKPGERTVLDAMEASAVAGEIASEQGTSPAVTLERAAAAAQEGAAATAEMQPRHGRAGWIGERARGRPDAGAVAWSVYVGALADGVTHAQP